MEAKGSKWFILAEEINAIVKAVNELYDSAESLPNVEEKVNAAKIAIFQKLTGNDSGDLTTLQTAVKTHLIGAINSVQKQLNELKLIDDSLEASKDKTYSIDKIQSLINDSLVPMLDKAMAEKTYISKNEFEQLMRGGIAKHRINNIHGVLDSSSVSEQVIEIVGSGFEVFSDNVASISLQNSISGENIDGKYVYNIKYIDNEHLTVTFQLLDIVPNGDYYIYLYDIDGGIYKNQLNVGGAGVVKIGGYTQLDFDSWVTVPSNGLTSYPNTFLGNKNSFGVGSLEEIWYSGYKESIKSTNFIPADKNFDIELNISHFDNNLLYGINVLTNFPSVIGLTANTLLTAIPTDIINGVLCNKSKTNHNVYYSESGGQTDLIGESNIFPRLPIKLKITGSLTQLFITITFNNITISKTVDRLNANLYLKAVVYKGSKDGSTYGIPTNWNTIGANINCKIW